MNQRRIMGGVTPSLPLSKREPKEWKNWYHAPGEFHQARWTRMPHLSWAIYRLRRARVGQLSLFGRKRKVRITRKIRHIVPFWGYGVSQYQSRKRKTS